MTLICMMMVSCGKKKHNGHEYVDLGLSVKWATCNVGATSPEDFGHYFAWGETSPKDEYTEDNCSTCGKQMSDIAGNAQYDAATANWGGDWRMPTKAEQEELLNNCTWTWTTQNGVNGYNVKGPNGNSIFLPAAGSRKSSLYGAGSGGGYWGSTPYDYSDDYSDLCDYSDDYSDLYDYSYFFDHLYDHLYDDSDDDSDDYSYFFVPFHDHAYYLYFSSDFHYMRYDYRYYGHSVRPVLE